MGILHRTYYKKCSATSGNLRQNFTYVLLYNFDYEITTVDVVGWATGRASGQ